MLLFEFGRANLCFFPSLPPAVFAQHEDHLSLYDWRPDQALWDRLPGVARPTAESFSEKKHRLRLWVLNRGGCLHGVILFTGSRSPPSQSETWKQATRDNYLSHTPVRRSESPACRSEQRRPERVQPPDCCWCCDVCKHSYEPDQEPFELIGSKHFFFCCYFLWWPACVIIHTVSVLIWSGTSELRPAVRPSWHFDCVSTEEQKMSATAVTDIAVSSRAAKDLIFVILLFDYATATGLSIPLFSL